MRILTILVIAALGLAGCNANQGVNVSSQTASQVFAGHYSDNNPYNPSATHRTTPGAAAGAKSRWHDVSMKVKGMVKLSATAAIVTYECDAKRKDGQAHRALVSSGYVSRPDGWKLAFHQQTPLQ